METSSYPSAATLVTSNLLILAATNVLFPRFVRSRGFKTFIRVFRDCRRKDTIVPATVLSGGSQDPQIAAIGW